MALPHTGETLANPEGKVCPVIDPSRIDFSNAVLGRKRTETLVRRAQGGEEIVTRNSAGKIETTYTTKPGDAIFVNLHDEKDTYCPGNPDNTRWQFDDLLKKGYEITAGSMANGTVKVKSTATSKILPEAVTEDVCIKDAWGPGKHQFLYKGATLKLNDGGHVTGIDKSAFDATWEIMTPSKPAAPPPPRRGP
jgi:hypothetical protein